MSTKLGAFDDFKKIVLERRRPIIYLMVGCAAIILDYFTFIVLYTVLKQDVAIAAPIGLTVGLIASFTLNKVYTFSDQAKTGLRHTGNQLTLYLLLFIFNNIFTITFINLLLSVGVSAAIGKLGATVVITLWNYILYKAVVFK